MDLTISGQGSDPGEVYFSCAWCTSAWILFTRVASCSVRISRCRPTRPPIMTFISLPNGRGSEVSMTLSAKSARIKDRNVVQWLRAMPGRQFAPVCSATEKRVASSQAHGALRMAFSNGQRPWSIRVMPDDKGGSDRARHPPPPPLFPDRHVDE